MNRRDWLKTAALIGGSTLLPEFGANAASDDAGRHVAGVDGAAHQPAQAGARERLLADFGWRFHLGHADDPAKDFGYGRGRDGAFGKSGHFFEPSHANFDDSAWTAIDLPHDWAVELPFIDDPELVEHGAKPIGRMHPATSIGWYRRTFEIPAGDLGRRVAIDFDGVFRDCMVALNGHYIGRNLSGYAPFRLDVTDFINYGAKNVLCVRVDATEFEGWFYEGAGIYRHVWLEKTAPLHVAHRGTFVTADVKADTAVLTIRTDVENDAGSAARGRVTSRIVDRDGKEVAATTTDAVDVPAWSTRTVSQQVSVRRPRLWSLETPDLYTLETALQDGRGESDRTRTPFGIRTVHFDPDKGFFLNGKPVKLQGTCNHQDHAGVGAALPDRLQSFRVETLKSMGCNAYRTSHNAPASELLDACDRLGMLVLDETRTMSSNPEGLSQFERLIRRDRNHPCVFCWSIGNEEPEQGTERGARIAESMKRLARELDPTRPITEAMNNEGSWGKGVSTVVDVQGFNYGHTENLDAFHTQFPAKPAMGSETASTVSTRGIYENDKVRGYVSAYDVNIPPWAQLAEYWWPAYAARPWVAGGFAWTGFDYRGEPTPYSWPCISSHFGSIDTCGFPKDNFYYYKAWWTNEPVLHLFPHWNWTGKEGQEIDVWCYSNLDRIELFVNGKSAGAQDMKRYTHTAWKVPFAAGSIEAHGFKDGKRVLTARRETTGPAAKILLRPDRDRINADGEDVSVVVVEIADAEGRMVPIAMNQVTFRVTGPARIIGVGNGDPSSHEPDRASERRAFNGLCVGIVQGTKQAGDVRIQAASPGLETATVVIATQAVTSRPALV